MRVPPQVAQTIAWTSFKRESSEMSPSAIMFFTSMRPALSVPIAIFSGSSLPTRRRECIRFQVFKDCLLVLLGGTKPTPCKRVAETRHVEEAKFRREFGNQVLRLRKPYPGAFLVFGIKHFNKPPHEFLRVKREAARNPFRGRAVVGEQHVSMQKRPYVRFKVCCGFAD